MTTPRQTLSARLRAIAAAKVRTVTPRPGPLRRPSRDLDGQRLGPATGDDDPGGFRSIPTTTQEPTP